jgi:hypothetical protein
MTNYHRYARSPRALRRRHVRLDNIVILPGDMLPFKAAWEKIAGQSPSRHWFDRSAAVTEPAAAYLRNLL